MVNHEWSEQMKLARQLDKWLDDTCSFATATDPVASSALSGWLRRRRGVKAGTPDTLVWHRKRSIAIEMKSRGGRCSPAQREVREALIKAGVEWWMCKSARAAMWALKESGVKFRAFVREDGSIERWRQPALEPWEVPRRDPSERRAMHPGLAAKRRDEARRRRERRARGLAATEREGAVSQSRQTCADPPVWVDQSP
ncbi:MAG TPA: VRR-NUC domain-containing protein [Roseiarcus sp.]